MPQTLAAEPADDGDGDAGRDEQDAEAAEDPEEATNQLWDAVRGALRCSEEVAANILQKSLAIRMPEQQHLDLLQSEEVQDAMNRDEWLETDKFLGQLAAEEKALSVKFIFIHRPCHCDNAGVS